MDLILEISRNIGWFETTTLIINNARSIRAESSVNYSGTDDRSVSRALLANRRSRSIFPREAKERSKLVTVGSATDQPRVSSGTRFAESLSVGKVLLTARRASVEPLSPRSRVPSNLRNSSRKLVNSTKEIANDSHGGKRRGDFPTISRVGARSRSFPRARIDEGKLPGSRFGRRSRGVRFRVRRSRSFSTRGKRHRGQVSRFSAGTMTRSKTRRCHLSLTCTRSTRGIVLLSLVNSCGHSSTKKVFLFSSFFFFNRNRNGRSNEGKECYLFINSHFCIAFREFSFCSFVWWLLLIFVSKLIKLVLYSLVYVIFYFKATATATGLK